jgi:quercetin dioxygenase-like cupin family protein
MSAYTKKNLQSDVEDMAPQFGIEGLESHFARRALELEKSGVSYYKIAPGGMAPFGHKHEVQEEIYVLISGSATIKIEDEMLELGRLDAIRLAPDAMRAVKGGPEGAEMIAFGAPQPAEQDAEMVPGWWEG